MHCRYIHMYMYMYIDMPVGLSSVGHTTAVAADQLGVAGNTTLTRSKWAETAVCGLHYKAL